VPYGSNAKMRFQSLFMISLRLDMTDGRNAQQSIDAAPRGHWTLACVRRSGNLSLQISQEVLH